MKKSQNISVWEGFQPFRIYHLKGKSTSAQYDPGKESKLDDEKSKHVGLVQQNGFGPTFLHSLLRGW